MFRTTLWARRIIIVLFMPHLDETFKCTLFTTIIKLACHLCDFIFITNSHPLCIFWFILNYNKHVKFLGCYPWSMFKFYSRIIDFKTFTSLSIEAVIVFKLLFCRRIKFCCLEKKFYLLVVKFCAVYFWKFFVPLMVFLEEPDLVFLDFLFNTTIKTTENY